MAKIIISSGSNVVCEYDGGRVQASIIAVPRGKWAYTIKTNGLRTVSALQLADYADAIRKVCKHVAKQIRKEISIIGRNIDFDEPALDLENDMTVEGRVFPHDTRVKIYFTRYAETGKVLADMQSFVFTDIPSAIQVAHVAIKASNLMKHYEAIV